MARSEELDTISHLSASIAMATCNGERYVEEQLASFACQSQLPDELVVCDDASTDATPSLLSAFARRAPFPVRVLVNSHRQGHIATFERAIGECHSSIVLLSDQDDVWDPEKIAVVQRWFAAHTLDQLVLHDLEFCDAALRPLGQTKLERVKSFTDPLNYATGAAMAVRRSFAELTMPFPRDLLGHDEWMNQCAVILGVKGLIPDVLGLYRRHSGAVTAGGALNVGRVTTRRDFTAGRATSNPRGSLRGRVGVWGLVSTWLVSRGAAIAGLGCASHGQVTAAAVTVLGNARWCETRLRILDRPRTRRLWPVLRMYFRGGYSIFSGIRSAAKDLVVP